MAKNRNFLIRSIRSTVLITAGALAAGLGVKGFLMSSHFIDGGVTGISMLASTVSGWPLGILIAVINIPFIILGYFMIGLPFAIRSVLGILGLAFCIEFVPYPDVTQDKLLTAVFGGFFVGTGIGLAMRGGAVLDGTEAVAVMLSRKGSLLKVGDFIMVFNVVIFGTAVFVLNVESALYSMITYFAASKTVDFLVHGIEEYTAMLIVSDRHEVIRRVLTHHGLGITSLQGNRSFTRLPIEVLYVVVTRLETVRIKQLIAEADPKAFVVQYPVNDVMGGKVKSMPLH